MNKNAYNFYAFKILSFCRKMSGNRELRLGSPKNFSNFEVLYVFIYGNVLLTTTVSNSRSSSPFLSFSEEYWDSIMGTERTYILIYGYCIECFKIIQTCLNLIPVKDKQTR